MPVDDTHLCAEFEADILHYHSGELPRQRHAAWHSHLETCNECRTRYEAITATLIAYAELPTPEISDRRFAQAVSAATRHRTAPPVLRRRPVQALGAALAVAAAILLYVIQMKTRSAANFDWSGATVDAAIARTDSSLATIESSRWLQLFNEAQNEASWDAQMQDLRTQVQRFADELQTAM